jgi:hypothetical protein
MRSEFFLGSQWVCSAGLRELIRRRRPPPPAAADVRHVYSNFDWLGLFFGRQQYQPTPLPTARLVRYRHVAYCICFFSLHAGSAEGSVLFIYCIEPSSYGGGDGQAAPSNAAPVKQGEAWRIHNHALQKTVDYLTFSIDVIGAVECPAEISGVATNVCNAIKAGVLIALLTVTLVAQTVSALITVIPFALQTML